MEYGVLGPLAVGEDASIEIGAPKHRVLLCRLLVNRNDVVSVDQLTDALWGARPPASAAKLVQVYVSQVRKLLGADAIDRRGSGYVVRVVPGSFDVARFERLLLEGREALREENPQLAAALFGRALALWRGPAYADVTYEEFASTEIRRLEELRLQCLEERIGADLASGRHEAVLGEVLGLIAEHPLRERLRHHLMLALYRSGRQADALEAYGAARHTLREELGLEPGHALRALEHAILEHDPSLAAPRQSDVGWRLPSPPNPLIGRRAELDRLAALVTRSDVRLVTVAGAGGSGKTRLALELARELGGTFANGAFFVELAAVRQADLVLPTVAQALDVTADPGEAIGAAIGSRLASRELLLVADNFEHVIDAGPALAGILRWAPNVTIVTTSRRVLHLSGEHVFPLEPLPPDDAVALFVARAQALTPSFSLTPDDLQVVREICRSVDGLPLAIELAAAHTSAMSPADLLAGLVTRLGLLTDGPRDLPTRQQTLRDTIAWSTDLLDTDERADFAALGVFAGGCTIDAAISICRTSSPRISSLVDSHLVSRVGRGDDTRLSMLETVREHAIDLLGDDRETVAARHAEHYGELATRWAAEIGGAGEGEAMRTLETEHNNLRAALTFLAEVDASACIRLTAHLWRFWWGGGHLAEGRSRLDAALALDDAPSAARAAAARGASTLAVRQGDYTAAERHARVSVETAEAIDDPRAQAQALGALGNALLALGRIEEARSCYERSAALAARADAVREHAVALLNLGNVALYTGDPAGVEELGGKSIALFRTIDDMPGVATNLANMGHAAIQQGALDRAEELFDESRRLYVELDFHERVAMAVDGLAAVAGARGDHMSAARQLGAVDAMLYDVGAMLEPFELDLHDRTAAAARSALGEEAFSRITAEGAVAQRQSLP